MHAKPGTRDRHPERRPRREGAFSMPSRVLTCNFAEDYDEGLANLVELVRCCSLCVRSRTIIQVTRGSVDSSRRCKLCEATGDLHYGCRSAWPLWSQRSWICRGLRTCSTTECSSSKESTERSPGDWRPSGLGFAGKTTVRRDEPTGRQHLATRGDKIPSSKWPLALAYRWACERQQFDSRSPKVHL